MLHQASVRLLHHRPGVLHAGPRSDRRHATIGGGRLDFETWRAWVLPSCSERSWHRSGTYRTSVACPRRQWRGSRLTEPIDGTSSTVQLPRLLCQRPRSRSDRTALHGVVGLRAGRIAPAPLHPTRRVSCSPGWSGYSFVATLAQYKGTRQDIGILVPVSVISGVAVAGVSRFRKAFSAATFALAAAMTLVLGLPFSVLAQKIGAFQWAIHYVEFPSRGRLANPENLDVPGWAAAQRMGHERRRLHQRQDFRLLRPKPRLTVPGDRPPRPPDRGRAPGVRRDHRQDRLGSARPESEAHRCAA